MFKLHKRFSVAAGLASGGKLQGGQWGEAVGGGWENRRES